MLLRQRGIACSRTSVYNAPGNGQCQRYIWTAIKPVIKSRKLDIAQWECVLPDALHSIRFLLCTATNATPHGRLFHFTRRSTFGVSIPTWLSAPGPVFLKRHLRSSKYDPIVDEVEPCACDTQLCSNPISVWQRVDSASASYCTRGRI